MSITKISTVGMSRADWLAQRRKSIGGSDAAGIIGLSRWASPYTVWADKTGRLPDKEDTEAMRIGRDLEEYVVKRWEEATGKRAYRCNAMLHNDLYPFAHADVDRMVRGEKAGLECKTTSALNLKLFKNGEFPEQYYTQCVHYMAVTGAEVWYLAVLVLGRGFFVYELRRDQEEIDALMAAEADFWTYVGKDTPPPADGLEATGEALGAVFPVSTREEPVDLMGEEQSLSYYMELKDQKKRIDEALGQIENTIKARLEDHSGGACAGFSVSWKSSERSTFEAKRFAADHPDVDLRPYYKSTTVRPFRVARAKE